MNVICLGGLVTGEALSWELVQTFLHAHFKGTNVSGAVLQKWRHWKKRRSLSG